MPVHAKFGSAASLVNPSLNGSVGAIGDSSSGTVLFRMHMRDWEATLWTNAEPTEGAGDANPVVESDGEIYGRYVLRGAVVAALAIGIASLKANNSGPTGNPQAVSITLALESGREHNVTVLVHNIWLHPVRNRALIPIVMQCWMTNTTASSIETSTA